MLLAQVDPTQVSALGSFAEKFGFNALLVLALLYGLWKMNQSHRDERTKREELDRAERVSRSERDERREEARRTEREADRKAHVDALGAHTTALGVLNTAVARMDDKLDALAPRRMAGGG